MFIGPQSDRGSAIEEQCELLFRSQVQQGCQRSLTVSAAIHGKIGIQFVHGPFEQKQR
jgi:hypothetical protein